MFCPNCGKEVKDGVAFCTNCGTKLSFSNVSAEDKPDTEPAGSNPSNAQPSPDEDKMKRKNRMAWVLLAAIVLLVIVLFVVVNYISSKRALERDKAAAAATATEFLEAVKSVDLETLEKDYAGNVDDINLETIDSTADFPELDDLDSQITNSHVERLREFDYSLGEPTISNEQATIPLTIKTFGYSSLIEKWRIGFKDYCDKNVFTNPEEMAQLDTEELEGQNANAFAQVPDSKDYTGRITLNLTKDDNNKWMVNELTGEELDTFFGGIEAFVKQIEEDEDKPIHIGKDNSGVITAYRGKTVAYDANGLYPCEEDGEWYFITVVSINTSYEGPMYNDSGWWYVRNGKVDFSKNGNIDVSGVPIEVKNGQVMV